MSKEFKGIWIPREIMEIDNSGVTEKMILSIILSLEKNGGCKASNRYFAELLGITKTRVSIIIQNLYKKSYIGCISKVKGGIQEKDKRVCNFTYTGYITKVIDINRSINRSNNNIYPFENFWNLYDKKRGSKTKIENKWDKLSESTQAEIMAYIPRYIESQPDKQFRKDPSTFFNNESWKDELIGSTKQKSGFNYEKFTRNTRN